MDDPVERRMLGHFRRKKRDNPDMAAQMRRFRKSGKLQVDKTVKPEVAIIKQKIKRIKDLELRARDLISLRHVQTKKVTDAEATVRQIELTLKDAKAMLVRARHEDLPDSLAWESKMSGVQSELQREREDLAAFIDHNTLASRQNAADGKEVV